MKIVKEEPPKDKKIGRGRTPKYAFRELKPGECLKVPVIGPTGYHRVMAALTKFKEYNNLEWDTTTRFDGSTVSVYRLK